jgi:hypothetical protein
MSKFGEKWRHTPAEKLAKLKSIASKPLAPGLPGPAEYLARDPELRDELERERVAVNAAAPPSERSDPGSLVIPAGVGIPNWEPRSKPQEMLLKCPAQLVLAGGAAGSLKALDVETPIPTPGGFTPMRDIAVGDIVFDDCGHQCTVTAVGPITQPAVAYRLRFDDGEEIIADAGHYWKTMTRLERTVALRRDEAWKARRRAKRPGRGKRPKAAGWRPATCLQPPTGTVRTTAEIAATLKAGATNNHSVAMAQPIELPEAALPIPPYTLGAWLGDGNSRQATIIKPDAELFDEIRKDGFTVTNHAGAWSHGILGLLPMLRRCGLLGLKAIPAPYFRASIAQRLALIQGLMDTDGCAQKSGACYFSTCAPELAWGMREMLCSLGIKAAVSTGRAVLNGVDHGASFALHFTPPMQVFRLPRKASRLRLATRPTTTRRYIVAAELVEGGEVRCISVSSPSRLYLAGRAFIPTHNSETMLVDAILERDNPNLRAILFRKTFPELDKSLIRRSHELYAAMGAKYNDQKHAWRFPSGGIVEFGYCERDKDIFKYQGAQYTFIGFDESTHFAEEPIRYLTSRLRSTDPSLFLRIRLATNPGNVGHVFHRSIFQGPKCLHCLEQEGESLAGARQPFRIYDDARWPSDGRLIGFSTCYIPGRLTDHNLLGPEYAKQLEGLSAKFREALLAGCWGAFEGQYFECWNQSRMVIPANEIPVQPWWPHWAGADYGFSISQASAHLLCRSEPCDGFPRGRVYVVDEYTSKHEPAPDFARSLWRNFAVKRGTMTEPQRIQAWYLSPDSFSNRGDGNTLADQMYQGSGIAFQSATDDRVAGAMLIYTMLNSGELMLSDKCPQLAEALQTRIHDPNRNDDVLKVKGDPLDDVIDSCLTAGTLIRMGDGRDVPIEMVCRGDMVLTRKGPRRVLRAWRTRVNAPTVTVAFANGALLRGTEEHPLWVEGRGFAPLMEVMCGDQGLSLSPCNSTASPSGAAPIGTAIPQTVPVRVLGKRAGGRADVYNLEVEGEPEYFANGVLVHNCRYTVMSHVGPAKRSAEQLLAEAQRSSDPTIAMLQQARTRALLGDGSAPRSFSEYLNRGKQRPRTTGW